VKKNETNTLLDRKLQSRCEIEDFISTMRTTPAKKILYVENSSRLGGANFSLIRLAENLDEEKYKAGIICPTFGEMCQLCRNKKIPFAIAPRAIPSKLWPFPFRQSIKRLRRLAEQSQAGIIHANAVSAYSVAGVVAGEMGIPAVMHIRSAAPTSQYRWMFGHSPLPDAVIGVSRAVVASLWPETLKDKLHIIHNGISVEEFRQARGDIIRQKLLSDRNTELIGTIAFMRPEKGLENIIKIAGLARGAGYNCHFAIAGYGPEKEHLEQMTQSLGLSDRISFPGSVENIAEFLKALDIFVLPSLTDALPGSLLEAGAASLASVASDVGGVPEIIQDGKTGFLVPVGDVELMWQKVRFLLDNINLRESMGQAAQHRIEKHFSIAAYVNQVSSLYDWLIKG